jgi:hypothetical protein
MITKPKSMRHVEKALHKMVANQGDNELVMAQFISIENATDVKGIAPIVKFTIQSDPIKEVGVNGIQAIDMLKYVGCLFESLDEVYPCIENKETIINIQAAIEWQNQRTLDRITRQVEGENKA